ARCCRRAWFMPNTAIILTTHFLDQNIVDMFHRIRIEAKEHYDVFLALNLMDGPLTIPTAGQAIKDMLYLCNDATLLRLPYPEKCRPEGWSGKKWKSSDNVDTIILSFYYDHPEYTYYWGIEYDVHFEGKWNVL